MNARLNRPLKVFFCAALLLALAGLLLVWILHTATSQRSGELKLEGLSGPVSVYYDAWGVPHIDAQSEHDAYLALGYVHAQDRLFQMDLLRRIGGGRLSELLGVESFATDRFFRTLGISRYARQYAERLEQQADSPHAQLIHAYQDGINQYIDHGGRPLEYRLLMTKPDYFSAEDIANTMGYMAYSFAEAFKTDALVDTIRGTLSERHYRDLVPSWPDQLPPVRSSGQPYIELLTPMLEQISQVEQTLPVGQFLGSNAWVVNAERSASGAPLLANDPHIGFAAPAVWYEAHIRTPDNEVYGHFLAGIPFPLLGQTRHHAWGLTMLMNDDVDFYRERVNPDDPEQVWAVDRWQKLRIHEEVIKIRGQEDRLIRTRSSRHGPIINDLPGSLEREPVSLFWSFLDPENDSASAFYGFTRATSLEEFQTAAALHSAPGLNLIYADVDDNIAMWAIGKLKRWPQSSNGFSLLNGGSGRDDFLGYQPFDTNPRIINPRDGVIFSTNNPYPENNPRRKLPGYYAPTDRAQRLQELLNREEPFDLSDFKAFQLDDQRPLALSMIADAMPLLDPQQLPDPLQTIGSQALALLGAWDGHYHRDSQAASIFQRWQDALSEALFADELGPRYSYFRNTFMAEKTLASLYWKPTSPWWDNREHPSLDGRQAAISHAWQNALQGMVTDLGSDPQQWQWSRLATLQHQHALAERLPFGGYLNSQPVVVNGANETLNNMAFDRGTGYYQIKAGPSTRRLIDLSDLNSSLGINPLGQAGNPLDSHARDQAELFNEGRYRAQLFDWLSIRALPDHLVLQPD
ncbi:penicillin acylase family protein [Halopseudomonas maritima]|uniref:penicillin acylase family protein n=1 Tax=Halopseudomonas maritima TaxID=2918528 RepID=UPI001EECBE27|nr:penicillin acylase family protein [Halopseudomonas maritima]UJJ31350.1 penicillin acylase family protein [Halopseudomonas maritima]